MIRLAKYNFFVLGSFSELVPASFLVMKKVVRMEKDKNMRLRAPPVL